MSQGDREAVERERERQRDHDQHMTNLQAGARDERSGETTAILQTLSEIDDLPINPESDRIMGQLVAQLTSTTNLSAQEVRSNEWVREYILLLYLCKFPTREGMSGTWRGLAHGDHDEAVPPLPPEKRTELEAFVSNSKLALKRSEDAKVIEESTRNRTESFVHDDNEDDGGGGLLGRL